jgi:hypothetical protein
MRQNTIKRDRRDGPFGSGSGMQADSGQVVPLMGVLLAMLMAIGLVLVGLGNQVANRAQANGIADATALAGARGGEQAARDLAAQNHAEIVKYVSQGSEVEVTVEIGHGRASARARRQW